MQLTFVDEAGPLLSQEDLSLREGANCRKKLSALTDEASKNGNLQSMSHAQAKYSNAKIIITEVAQLEKEIEELKHRPATCLAASHQLLYVSNGRFVFVFLIIDSCKLRCWRSFPVLLTDGQELNIEHLCVRGESCFFVAGHVDYNKAAVVARCDPSNGRLLSQRCYPYSRISNLACDADGHLIVLIHDASSFSLLTSSRLLKLNIDANCEMHTLLQVELEHVNSRMFHHLTCCPKGHATWLAGTILAADDDGDEDKGCLLHLFCGQEEFVNSNDSTDDWVRPRAWCFNGLRFGPLIMLDNDQLLAICQFQNAPAATSLCHINWTTNGEVECCKLSNADIGHVLALCNAPVKSGTAAFLLRENSSIFVLQAVQCTSPCTIS